MSTAALRQVVCISDTLSVSASAHAAKYNLKMRDVPIRSTASYRYDIDDAGSDIGGEKEIWSDPHSVSCDSSSRQLDTRELRHKSHRLNSRVRSVAASDLKEEPFRTLQTSNRLKWFINCKYDYYKSGVCVWGPRLYGERLTASYLSDVLTVEAKCQRKQSFSRHSISTNDMPYERGSNESNRTSLIV